MKRAYGIIEEVSPIKKMRNTVSSHPSLKRPLEIDTIDFTSLKRMRVESPQVADIEPIIQRVTLWLLEQRERNNLPKTFCKLMRCISPMCRLLVQVDPSVVFYHLLFNKIILVEQPEAGKVLYLANPEPLSHSFIGIVPDGSPPIPFSEDFIHALERATAWILNNRGLHYYKSIESLLASMDQVCRFKRELSPTALVDLLKRKGYLSTGYADEVCYTLPHEISPPAALHYPPSYFQEMEVAC